VRSSPLVRLFLWFFDRCRGNSWDLKTKKSSSETNQKKRERKRSRLQTRSGKGMGTEPVERDLSGDMFGSEGCWLWFCGVLEEEEEDNVGIWGKDAKGM